MKLTERDAKLVRDVALSTVLSRNQVLQLGYFSSVSRANRRLQFLCAEGLLQAIDTPFHAQRLYSVGRHTPTVLGDNLSRMLTCRTLTPRFIQHALAVTELRIGLADAASVWRFEAQVRHQFSFGNQDIDLRPDGLLLADSEAIFVEADLGHVSMPRFEKRFEGYSNYINGGNYGSVYGRRCPRVLLVTTGDLRKSHLEQVARAFGIEIDVKTFSSLSVPVLGGWS